MYVIHCKTMGIWSIENRNPDNKNAGRKVMMSAAWLAANWFLAATEMKKPSKSTTTRNKAELTVNVR